MLGFQTIFINISRSKTVIASKSTMFLLSECLYIKSEQICRLLVRLGLNSQRFGLTYSFSSWLNTKGRTTNQKSNPQILRYQTIFINITQNVHGKKSLDWVLKVWSYLFVLILVKYQRQRDQRYTHHNPRPPKQEDLFPLFHSNVIT